MRGFCLFIMLFGGMWLKLSAQNPLFTAFDQPSHQVTEFLTVQPNVDFRLASDHLIQAHRGGQFMEYRFNPDGRLYKITLFKNFEKKKEAMSALADFMEYYRIHKGNVSISYDYKELSKRLVNANGSQNTLYVMRTPTKEYQLKVISSDPLLDPLTDNDLADSTPSEKISFSLNNQ